jgi:hypothetical protein
VTAGSKGTVSCVSFDMVALMNLFFYSKFPSVLYIWSAFTFFQLSTNLQSCYRQKPIKHVKEEALSADRRKHGLK